jgi:ABC-type Fe3+-hydroxamate transport system substrate-binding protein
VELSPKRIVSLVPSITELLFDLGLENHIVGVTRFCVHPIEAMSTKQIIGGTKNIHIEKVRALQPDLIIANKEENVKEQIEDLASFAKIMVTDVANYDSAIEMIRSIGFVTGKLDSANELIEEIIHEFTMIPKFPMKKVCYLIWNRPYMSIGSDTFIHSMLEKIGFENVMSDTLRYPEIQDIATIQADYIFLSSEPFPFKQRHIDELSATNPKSKIIQVDGELFSWYGSRMKKAPAYFKELFEHL